MLTTAPALDADESASAQNHDKKYVLLAASQLVNRESVSSTGAPPAFLWAEMCELAQIITNYLPLAIHRSIRSMIAYHRGRTEQKSQSITLPARQRNSLGHWMFTSGKGPTAEGLYKTDMLTAMAEQKMLAWKLVVLVNSS